MQHKPLPGIPVQSVTESQPAFSVQSGGRTFSFASKVPRPPNFGASKQPKDPPVTRGDSSPSAGPFRNRTMTESSYASTATPPKLETDLVPSDLGGFAGIFDNIGRRRSELLEENELTVDSVEAAMGDSVGVADKHLPLVSSRTTEMYSNARPDVARPSPLQINRSREIEPAAYSWGSHGSGDRLMVSPSPPLPTSSSTGDPAPPVPQHRIGPASPETVVRKNATAESIPGTPRARQPRPNSAVSGGLKRSSAIIERRSTMPLLEDEDARLVLDSVNASRSIHRKPEESPTIPKTPVSTVKDQEDLQNDGLTQTSPSIIPSRTSPSPGHEFSPQKTIRNGSDQEANPLIPSVNNAGLGVSGVQIRRSASISEEQISSTAHRSGLSEAGDGDELDNQKSGGQTQEDIPRVESPESMKQASEKQSSKRPVLGSARSEIPIRSRVSSQNMLTSYSMDNLQGQNDGTTQRNSDDEDEDVPLGILAAHGFPNKNRPPARISITGSQANLQSLSQLNPYPPPTSSVTGEPGIRNPFPPPSGSLVGEPSIRNPYPPPPGSVVGEPSIRSGRTSTLPVFARGLPQDPYQAAGLMHPSNRDLLPSGLKSQGGIPPGGLVSVIAGEEKARALRRGSPMNQSGYGFGAPADPGFGSPLNPGFGNFAPGPAFISSTRQSFGALPNMNMTGISVPPLPAGLPPPISVADQAQIQMSQQMTEMMRTQIQWMQQMMQYQGMQGAPNVPQPIQQQPTLNVIPPPIHGSRPASISGMSMSSNSGVQPMHQRSVSMLDPGMAFPNQPPNNSQPFQYIPSFRLQAPNQPYAPSIAPSERSNVGLPSRYRPVSTGSSSAIEKDKGPPRASTFTSGMLKDWDTRKDSPPIGKAEAKPTSGGKPSDDDDDDEGWEEMKRKREKTKSKWKFKKEFASNKDTHVSEK